MKRVVIIGGGLAGLSAGYHLGEHDPVVFEKEAALGGLCRSFRQDGFTFDCTGHLVHLKNPYTRELIDNLLPGKFRPHERLAAIYSKSVTTPYPFQANTYGLPPQVIKECVLGFIATLNGHNGNHHANFREWVLSTFGTGIAEHFMLPYNEKFWKSDLTGITADWVSWSIPKPTLEEVINGALGLTNNGMGYNPRFIYPKDGGIDCLPLALSQGIRKIHRRHTLQLIDARKKFVRFDNGREEPFDSLVTTTPLPLTYELLADVPDNLRDLSRGLRAVSVLNFNIGIDRPGVSDRHWIYFPEHEYVFSRVGFPTNFSDAVAPPNTSSMYIEITRAADERIDVEAAFERAISDLHRCGILQREDRILTRNVIDIRCAYIVFDQHRQKHLADLIAYLEHRGIYSVGRYGRWDYYSMEDSILSGKSAADAISGALAGSAKLSAVLESAR
jgi:protoporphyrinogen oxidase